MKICHCRMCGKVFTAKKPKPFCGTACRHTGIAARTQFTQFTAILEGAPDDQTQHHSNA